MSELLLECSGLIKYAAARTWLTAHAIIDHGREGGGEIAEALLHSSKHDRTGFLLHVSERLPDTYLAVFIYIYINNILVTILPSFRPRKFCYHD